MVLSSHTVFLHSTLVLSFTKWLEQLELKKSNKWTYLKNEHFQFTYLHLLLCFWYILSFAAHFCYFVKFLTAFTIIEIAFEFSQCTAGNSFYLCVYNHFSLLASFIWLLRYLIWLGRCQQQWGAASVHPGPPVVFQVSNPSVLSRRCHPSPVCHNQAHPTLPLSQEEAGVMPAATISLKDPIWGKEKEMEWASWGEEEMEGKTSTKQRGAW